MDILNQIAIELKLNPVNVKKAVELLDQGDTVPFIARYRKEETGGLTDENRRDIEEKLLSYRNLEDRKKTVLKSLADQKIEDPKLLEEIDKCRTRAKLEDLYRPYKPKKTTRASKAKAAGLEPLSQYIRTDKTGKLEEEAGKYLSEAYPTKDKAIQGALDILAEKISDNPNYRFFRKNLVRKEGYLTSTKLKDAPLDTFDNYENYSKKISELRSYNVLAINRGVNKKCLTKKFVFPDEKIINHLETFELPSNSPYEKRLKERIQDSYDRLISPSVSNDIFSSLRDQASDDSIQEFKSSLRATLLVPPLKGRRILGFDPGFTHGCKLAFIDENGKVLDTYVLKDPFHSKTGEARAVSDLKRLRLKNKTFTVALGNGTASRESLALLQRRKKEIPELASMEIAIVSESGASIWSATKQAQKEFPDYEPNLRSAVSIARRRLDPLAELVKIPPESIGVGQYQYDIEKNKLSLALKGVVEDCVNYVGVNLNQASASLLCYVSGISSKVADSIVKYRDDNGQITSRKELLKIPYLGPKAFENCAGFLRIPESKEPLDNTAVHPESYPIAKAIRKEYQKGSEEETKEALKSLSQQDKEKLCSSLSVGRPTLEDILKELIQPSRDPRLEAKSAKLLDGVNDIKDLKVGRIREGTIRNVTGFGFFVDIGVEINGLVYLTEIRNGRVDDPHQYGKPGDIVKVKVINVDLQRKRISLSRKGV